MTESDVQKTAAPARGLGGAWAILLLVGVVIAVIGLALLRNQQGQPTDGTAPDFTLTGLDGTPFRLSEQRGRIVVLNFWASWCAPCADEAPALQALSARYAVSHPGRVQFVGVTHSDEPDDSAAFVARYGITYPNLPDTRADVSKRLYRITGVPETFLIDAEGQVVGFFYSAVDPVALAAAIDPLLAAAS